jgi:hypothetical protein
MRSTAPAMLITILLAAYGCQSRSPARFTEGSLTIGDLVTTPTIQRLSQPGQFRTRVVV